MGGAVIEEETISRAQYLDLVYSQYGTLYDLLFSVSLNMKILPSDLDSFPTH
jgi:hypothetical protein